MSEKAVGHLLVQKK